MTALEAVRWKQEERAGGAGGNTWATEHLPDGSHHLWVGSEGKGVHLGGALGGSRSAALLAAAFLSKVPHLLPILMLSKNNLLFLIAGPSFIIFSLLALHD